MKIVFCGPPHSGKSCLRYGLKEAIKKINGAPYPYVITACPDGEGSWYQEAYSNNPDHADLLKKAYKGSFSKEQVNKWAEWVEKCQLPLVFIDVGGIPDEKNIKICKSATHAIIMSSDNERFAEWYKFCEDAAIDVIAELKSDYTGYKDVELTANKYGIYQGSIHYLERGDLSVQSRPTVLQLANLIVEMVSYF